MKAIYNPQVFKLKYEFIEKNADGGEQEAQSYKVELGVDYNRDGEIDFTEEDQQQIEMLFWVNDDKDEKVGSYTTDDGKVVEIEDDVSSTKRDCNDDKIPCKRDLEDFARLQIRVDEITAERMPFEYYFKIEKEGNETPPNLNLFEAVKWNQFYLNPTSQEVEKVFEQLSKRRLSLVKNDKESFATITFQEISQKVYIAPYLFEGSTSGKGKIVLIVKGKDQNGNLVEICRKEAKIHLEPIDYFYDKYVLDIQDYDDDIPDNQAYLDSAAGYSGDPNSNDYILFVHGWNWNMWEKKRYTETMFKRLWWQGYKGKMGVFIWPCRQLISWDELFIILEEYDKSEIRAFRSAQMLLPILDDLKNSKSKKVHIFAHSQGNMVVGEALKQAPGGIVDSYIAAQAALPGHCYDQGADPMTNKLERNSGIWTNYETPNVYAYYHSGQAPDQPYFGDNYKKVGKMFNYFNRMDWVLGLWMWDQRAKPDIHYHYKDKDGDIDTYNPNSEDPKNGDRFYYDTLIPGDERTLTFEGDDVYMILARCAEARSLALGQTGENEKPVNFKDVLNLELAPLEYQSDVYSHSREFRSDIVMEWPFWEQLKIDFGF